MAKSYALRPSLHFRPATKRKNPPGFTERVFSAFVAGKEGQVSNQFVPDLDQITDFLDRHRVEIEAIPKEAEKIEGQS